MLKRPAPRNASAQARRRPSRVPPDERASGAVDASPGGAWDADRTDIERPNERQSLSIETVPRDAQAGGVEAPESSSEERIACGGASPRSPSGRSMP